MQQRIVGDFIKAMTVTFFGHSDTPECVRDILRIALIDLIINHDSKTFYVGNHGNFDKMAKSILNELSVIYPHITYAVVLAYMPSKNNNDDLSPTIYPEGLETVPQRFAICKRNEWMINHSDVVITYVNRNFGGAAKYKKYAERKNKTVINLI